MNTSTNPLVRARTPFERRLIGEIERNKPHHSVGVFGRPLPGGVSQTVAKQRMSRVAVHPFYIFRTGVMHAGTVNGLIPTLGGEPIGESGNALTLGTSSGYVYACAVWALTFGATNFLASATLSSVTIVGNTTPYTDVTDLSGSTLTSYRLIAQIIGGVVQRVQQTYTNLLNSVCDASTGADDGKAVNSTWGTA